MDGEISAEDLQELLEANGDVRIVDIRSPAAFRRGHIPNSENVPFGELTDCIEDIADAERVVTVCPHGKASQQAARLIGSFEGFSGRVDSLEPGIEGWPYDLETAEGTASDGGSDEDEAADEGPEAPF
ncbi:MAG: rhodanese-related sulfurtransferase [Natronomonas sp.]|jgi:rhodanese-related sulfurtransferase